MSRSRLLRIVLVIAFWLGIGLPAWEWIADLRQNDEQVASKAHAFQEEIAEGMTRQEVRDLAKRFKPDESWSGLEAFWFNSRWEVHRVEVEYTSSAQPEGQPEDKAVKRKRNNSPTLPDDRVASVSRSTLWTGDNEKSLIFDFIMFVTSPRIFLVSMPFFLLWGISRLVPSQIWRAGLKPFWIPAVLWAAYGVWESFVMLQDGIRVDRVMIWPLLFLVSIGTAVVASWRLVQAAPVKQMPDGH